MIDINSIIENVDEFRHYAENMQFGDNEQVNKAYAELRTVLSEAVDKAIAVKMAARGHVINDADMDRENFDSDESFEKAQQ